MQDLAREFTANAILCPHPEARGRQTIYVRDPEGGASMGLCATCKDMFTDLAERRPGREEVYATLLAHGYTTEDAEQFWADLQREEASA